MTIECPGTAPAAEITPKTDLTDYLRKPLWRVSEQIGQFAFFSGDTGWNRYEGNRNHLVHFY
jgi:hypothetical protein